MNGQEHHDGAEDGLGPSPEFSERHVQGGRHDKAKERQLHDIRAGEEKYQQQGKKREWGNESGFTCSLAQDPSPRRFG